MLRKLLIVGVSAGISASVPIIYQKDPEVFQNLINHTFSKSAPARDATETSALPRVMKVSPEPEILPGRKVRLDSDERGHFTADFKLNGRPITALVDTGATLVAINASTAKRVGLHLQSSDFKYQVSTANGTTRAAAAKIDSLQIGRIYVNDVQVVVLEDSALDNALIGMSFLKRLSKFEVQDGSLLLVQ